MLHFYFLRSWILTSWLWYCCFWCFEHFLLFWYLPVAFCSLIAFPRFAVMTERRRTPSQTLVQAQKNEETAKNLQRVRAPPKKAPPKKNASPKKISAKSKPAISKKPPPPLSSDSDDCESDVQKSVQKSLNRENTIIADASSKTSNESEQKKEETQNENQKVLDLRRKVAKQQKQLRAAQSLNKKRRKELKQRKSKSLDNIVVLSFENDETPFTSVRSQGKKTMIQLNSENEVKQLVEIKYTFTWATYFEKIKVDDNTFVRAIKENEALSYLSVIKTVSQFVEKYVDAIERQYHHLHDEIILSWSRQTKNEKTTTTIMRYIEWNTLFLPQLVLKQGKKKLAVQTVMKWHRNQNDVLLESQQSSLASVQLSVAQMKIQYQFDKTARKKIDRVKRETQSNDLRAQLITKYKCLEKPCDDWKRDQCYVYNNHHYELTPENFNAWRDAIVKNKFTINKSSEKIRKRLKRRTPPDYSSKKSFDQTDDSSKSTIMNRYIEFSMHREMQNTTQAFKQQTLSKVKKLEVKFAKLERKIADELDELNHLHAKDRRQWERRMEKLKNLIFDTRHDHSRRHSERRSSRRYIDEDVEHHRSNERHRERRHRSRSSFRSEKRKRSKSPFRNEKRRRSHRERSPTLPDYATPELSYTLFIPRSRVMFSLSDAQSVYQNSSSSSIKLRGSSKRQIQNFIEWKIRKNRCLESERESDAYRMTDEILIEDGFSLRQVQTKKNAEAWWTQQDIKPDIGDELATDAKTFEGVWLERELKPKQGIVNSGLLDSMRGECTHFILWSCGFWCWRRSKRR